MPEPSALPRVSRTLGLLDLVLLGTVAIVNVNTVSPVVRFGWATLALWVLAWAAFFVPTGVAVVELSRRYAGEGGIYRWMRCHFGDAHGFIAGWCYWINNLFYVPVLLVYLAGVVAYAGGTATASLAERPWFVAAIALAWLALMTAAHVRGLGLGKWLNNIGGVSSLATVAVLATAAAVARGQGTAERQPAAAGSVLDLLSGLGVMCFAFIGIELASTMADEMRRPERDLGRSIVNTGAIALAAYLLATDALLVLVPAGELGAIQGVMQAIARAAETTGASWLVAPAAVVLALAIGGAASAWFAGPARIPFVAGQSSALPRALGRVHPRFGSPHLALLVCAALSAALTAFSLLGSSVAEAYQVLLRATVVLNLEPFVYLFLALLTLAAAGTRARVAGAVGALVTTAGILAAFVPDREVGSVLVFELKLLAGVAAPVGLGLWMFALMRRRSVD